jgi:glycosyltransferase involved in cell wall biosynthesis
MPAKYSLISIVIPFLNESQSLPILYDELEEVRKKQELNLEYIFIDDGSVDDSFEKLADLSKGNDRCKILQLRRNFGKSKALYFGMLHSKGDILITMDADLQDNPEDIVKLVEKLQEGYDLVGGWKKVRRDPATKTIPSIIFNWIVRAATGTNFHDINCGLKVYKRWVIDNVTLRGEHHRFPMVLAAAMGAQVTEVPANHRLRKFGRSKFGLERFIHGFLDLISVLLLTKYFERPLHFFAKPGLLLFAAGSCILSVLLGEHLVYLFTGIAKYQLVDRPLLIISTILIIAGIQIISVGLTLEYALTLKGRNNSESAFIKKKIHID